MGLRSWESCGRSVVGWNCYMPAPLPGLGGCGPSLEKLIGLIYSLTWVWRFGESTHVWGHFHLPRENRKRGSRVCTREELLVFSQEPHGTSTDGQSPVPAENVRLRIWEMRGGDTSSLWLLQTDHLPFGIPSSQWQKLQLWLPFLYFYSRHLSPTKETKEELLPWLSRLRTQAVSMRYGFNSYSGSVG